MMPDFLRDMRDFYQDRYDENGRMARQPLEFLRCKEIISRFLREDAMQIADIGGATGAFSYWLAGMGHSVHLLDYTQSHIEQARKNGEAENLCLESYTCGDARHMPFESGMFDLVLEMGPLYHLQQSQDRMRCLEEAMRTLKDGGILVCEVISRYSNLFEGFADSLIDDALFAAILDENLACGKHNPGDTPYFTTAFFHTPPLIEAELRQAGFCDVSLIAVEGFAFAQNLAQHMDDPARRDTLLKYIRQTESIPELLGVSGHIIATGVKRAR